MKHWFLLLCILGFTYAGQQPSDSPPNSGDLSQSSGLSVDLPVEQVEQIDQLLAKINEQGAQNVEFNRHDLVKYAAMSPENDAQVQVALTKLGYTAMDSISQACFASKSPLDPKKTELVITWPVEPVPKCLAALKEHSQQFPGTLHLAFTSAIDTRATVSQLAAKEFRVDHLDFSHYVSMNLGTPREFWASISEIVQVAQITSNITFPLLYEESILGREKEVGTMIYNILSSGSPKQWKSVEMSASMWLAMSNYAGEPSVKLAVQKPETTQDKPSHTLEQKPNTRAKKQNTWAK
jgi:hypothetical protein